MSDNPLEEKLVSVFPKNFLTKKSNEDFFETVMSEVLDVKKWEAGDPDKFEPDRFADGLPFEFTLACDRKKHNFITNFFIERKYSSDDVEKEVFSFIKTSIDSKSKKSYSVKNVQLCVLCLLDMCDWVSDYYGSLTYQLIDSNRKCFFNNLKKQYIDTGIFANLYIIFPDATLKWWVWDVLSDKKYYYQISDNDARNRKYPFIIPERYLSLLDKKVET